MWIKKEPFEIIKLFFLKLLKMLFISIIIIVPLLFFAGIASYHRYAQGELWIWRTVFGKIPLYLEISSAAGVLFFILNNIRPKTVICDKCFQITSYSKNRHCTCSGDFINIEFMKLIDENNSAPYKNDTSD
jgi:Na+/H+-dicarboxylate symporter